MTKQPIYDEFDAWASYYPSPDLVRRTPKRTRDRKPTLASVIAQARKAGVNIIGATVTKDGVTLEFGERGGTRKDDCTINTAEELLRLI